METYSDEFVRFRWPETWEFEREESDELLTLTVSSPETSFWSLSLLFDRPARADVVQSAIDSLTEKYEQVDIYSPTRTPEEQPGLSQDLDFICLELVNSAFLRCYRTANLTALVYYQGTDHELEESRPVMEAISRTLVFTDELEP